MVVKTPDRQLSEAELLDTIKHDLANYKQPKNLFFVDRLPRNTMGKVQKNLLRDRYGDTFTVS